MGSDRPVLEPEELVPVRPQITEAADTERVADGEVTR
jgi:hypothetical protein